MDQKQEIADRIKKANNILVTVKSNPSVDHLASCIGLTLAFNKMGKHATAVFSGAVPSTIEFLQPEKTLEANTDSLRDFIISLDKSKADKLRYKVEDTVVKIFITPYRTSISDKDLEFSQGDFNVDVVIALGVHDQGELDQSITAHGRILHDAAVVTVNTQPGGELGTINWLVPGASSLSELAVDLIDAIDKSIVDEQIATALLTGIVAETDRFSNQRTTPDTMSISAELMAAGANQQLVATKLAPPPPPPPQGPTEIPKLEDKMADQDAVASGDGTLEIAHLAEEKPVEEQKEEEKSEESKPEEPVAEEKPEEEKKDDDDKPANTDLDALKTEDEEPELAKIHIDDQGSLRNVKDMAQDEENKAKDATTDPIHHMGGGRMILQPPSAGSSMSGSGSPSEGFSDPLTLPAPSEEKPSGAPSAPPSSFGSQAASANIAPPPMPFMPASMTPGGSDDPKPGDSITPPGPPALTPDSPDGTLEPAKPDTSHLDSARDAVNQAISSQPTPGTLEPIKALNAQPLGDLLHSQPEPAGSPPDLTAPVIDATQPANPGLVMPAPVGSPPPVPPPMMPSQ